MKSNLCGKKFGRLTVFCQAGVHKRQRVCLWLCHCDCGNVVVTRSSSLNAGVTKSCGCYQHDMQMNSVVIHGHCSNGHRSRTAYSYHNAKLRCTNPNTFRYDLYGGRGIEFRFLNFQEFLDELGERPIGKTLDRINSDGHYEKGNVRWSTPKEQYHNRRLFYGK